jgi:hypothetical protein
MPEHFFPLLIQYLNGLQIMLTILPMYQAIHPIFLQNVSQFSLFLPIPDLILFCALETKRKRQDMHPVSRSSPSLNLIKRKNNGW